MFHLGMHTSCSPTFVPKMNAFKEMPKVFPFFALCSVWQLLHIDFGCKNVLAQVIAGMSDGMVSFLTFNTPECQSIQLHGKHLVFISLD